MNISLLEVKDGTEDEREVRANDGFFFLPSFSLCITLPGLSLKRR